jgi:hypothetical protein
VAWNPCFFSVSVSGPEKGNGDGNVSDVQLVLQWRPERAISSESARTVLRNTGRTGEPKWFWKENRGKAEPLLHIK